MARSFKTFDEFWPFYLEEHSNEFNRRLHVTGTSVAVGLSISSLMTQFWWGLLATLVGGYGFAWFGHFIVEKNRPATFTHPLWSLRADFKLWFLTVTGRAPEL